MKVISDLKAIQRNARIASYTSIVALLILGGGLYVSFAMPQQFYLSFIALMVGFILSQVGIYFGNRWGRSPRVDEQLNAALKGLTKEYNLYHYLTPVNHLLVGPSGVWILNPYYQRGTIVYEGERWKQKGGGLLLGYLKIFAQEGLGRPDLEVKVDIENLTKSFNKALGDQTPSINAALVFTDERVELDANDAPLPTLRIKELKDFMRKVAKENPYPPEELQRIVEVLPKEEDE